MMEADGVDQGRLETLLRTVGARIAALETQTESLDQGD
jgi:hypothetical protein